MSTLPTGRPPGMSPGPQRMGKAYQGALEAVLAVVVGVASGAFADSRLGTSPILLLLGVAAGFGAFVLRLVRLQRKLQPPAQCGAPDRSPEERQRRSGGSG